MWLSRTNIADEVREEHRRRVLGERRGSSFSLLCVTIFEEALVHIALAQIALIDASECRLNAATYFANARSFERKINNPKFYVGSKNYGLSRSIFSAKA